MRADWLRAQDRKRQLIAWALAGLVYLLVGGFVILRSVLGYETLSSGMGTIQIRIGTPEGEDEFSRIIPALSSPAGGEGLAQAASAAGEIPAPSASPAEVATPATQPPAPPEKAASVPKAAAQEAPAKTAAKPAPAKTAPAAATSAAPAGAVQGSAPATSGTGPAAAAVLTPSETGIPTGSPTGSGSVSLKGSEAGNSFETNFDTGSGKISRSLYVPIYLYMPLPRTLDKALYDAVPPSKTGMQSAELRKARLRDIYDMRGTLLTLKADVHLEIKDRPAIWVILEDAGYPLARADYKSGRTLRPIVIEFSVGPPAADYASSGAPLLSSSVVSSSGYPEIDEAVLYAFRMAGFSNNSKATVKGRFTYDFRN